MPSEALSVLFLDIHSASSGINGGTGCNFIFFRIVIVSSNKVMSKIRVQIRVNFEVNTSSEEDEALFLVVLEVRSSQKLCDPS